jgi:uncharacterized protein
MQITLDNNTGLYLIKAYGDHFVQINAQRITHSFALSPSELLDPWPVKTVNHLKYEDFHYILALKPNVILLGTGKTLCFPQPTIVNQLIQQKIGIEIMDTPAACRTYMALAAEGRAVVAALLL